jgi:hypothetical protein
MIHSKRKGIKKMKRKDNKTMCFPRRFISMILSGKDGAGLQYSDAGYVLHLAAEGIRAKFKSQGRRPPLGYLEKQTTERILILAAMWNDAIDGKALGGKYCIIPVPNQSKFYEEGKETFLPMPNCYQITDVQFFDHLAESTMLRPEEEEYLLDSDNE